MPRSIAFLRAINVGGRNVTMDTLRVVFAAMGLQKVETFIASGNVLFETPASGIGLEKQIETALEKNLGYEVHAFVRSAKELTAIAAHPAFPPAQIKKAQAYNVAFLKESLTAAQRESLAALQTKVDAFHVHGRELYWLCAVRQNESTFSNAVFERKLKVRATFRGMNTLTKLVAKRD